MACLANLPRKPTMIIRVTILILNIIVAALLGVAYALAYDGANGWFYADGLGPSLIGICWTAVAWSILWPGIALGLAIFHVQYHPGVDIGLDLFGIGLSWGFAIQLIVWTKDADWTRDWCESEYGYPGETRFCKPARRLDGLEYSSGALLLLAGCCNMALVIMACRATHLRRVQKKQSSFVELDTKAQSGEPA